MNEDLFAGYERAIDGLVNVIEAFPGERYDLLTGIVDEYAAQAGRLFDTLIARASDEATHDRLFALAAGDFRLAVELVVVPESVVPSGPPWRLELPSHQPQGG